MKSPPSSLEGSRREHHNRGLARFDRILRAASVETLSERIRARLKRVRRLRLLEIGCGEGRLILDLLKSFGSAIELHGVNHPAWPVIADLVGLQATNARYRVLAARSLGTADPAPRIHLAEAEDLGRFESGSFDFVVSQVALPHIRRKDRVLEESARLLKYGGVFIHDIDHLDAPAVAIGGHDLPRFVITRPNGAISTGAFLESHKVSLTRGRESSSKDVNIIAIHRRRGDPLRLRLRLDESATMVLRTLPRHVDGKQPWGVRSVFRA